MTWCYRALPGVTRGYKGIQGVTRDNKGLQGVTGLTRGYRVTGADKGLQKVT